MKLPWSILFWYKINLGIIPSKDQGIIVSYNNINVFLTTDKHIGISDGVSEFLGPIVTGLENSPWIFYGLTTDGSSIILYLNGEKVLEIAHGKLVFTIEQFHPEVSKLPHTYTKRDLSNWVKKRESMFKIQQETSSPYRLLTLNEQEQQLSGRIEALKGLLKDYLSGNKYYFADIVANLRALVLYKEKSQYDPLLLRIAAIKHLPLPIYVLPERKREETQLFDTIQPIIAVSDIVSFDPITPNTMNIDFQEFLESPSLFYQGQAVSPLTLIEMISTAQSTAHFDQRVSKIADALNDTPIVSGQNTLEYFVIGLSEVIVRLGDCVIHS